ncbi:MAG: DUF4280 domain-containing protein [Chloroflexota bacterium]
MAQLVINSAQMTCSFGTSPSSLTATPAGNPSQAGGQLVARITDMAPTSNIAPFGMCTTLSNPQVASATSAAQGVLTPQPCIPVTTGPWSPGSSKVMVGGTPALTSDSMCSCAWGGQITITNPGQTTVSG